MSKQAIDIEETEEEVEAEHTLDLIEQDEWVASHYRVEEETY